MSQVFVVRAADRSGQPIPGVFGELQKGRARIGWSSLDNQDLRLLQEKIRQWEILDADEREARRCLGFLTRVERDDYLLYPHQPVRKQFAVVQIKGKYCYSKRADGLNKDFRSVRHCCLLTPEPVALNDEIVPSQLRHRLGRPGRFSKVYETEPFFRFLEDLPNRGQLRDDPNQVSKVALRRIHNSLREKLPDVLQSEFSRADLSRQFCRELLKRMGCNPDVQEGRCEAGSDIVVDIQHPFLPSEFRVGVQVFSYRGTVEESDFQEKLDQLLKGWEENSLDYGVLLTTGRCSEDAVEALRDHNRKNPTQLVRLIDDNDLADLFLKYFPPDDLS